MKTIIGPNKFYFNDVISKLGNIIQKEANFDGTEKSDQK